MGLIKVNNTFLIFICCWKPHNKKPSCCCETADRTYSFKRKSASAAFCFDAWLP